MKMMPAPISPASTLAMVVSMGGFPLGDSGAFLATLALLVKGPPR